MGTNTAPATPRPRTTRVKICCIASIDEARLAIACGASAIGLVSAMPSGPGPIDEGLIAEIAETVPPGVATFLLTCQTSPERIVEQQRRTGANTLQLCDRLAPAPAEATRAYGVLRAAMPGVALVQVIHVRGRESVDEALAIAPHVNALLLDSGNQDLAVKELGGTGRVHDWSLSAEIVRAANRPVFLAGGLRPDNAAAAIETVRPYGLDVCTGLRTNGRLDEAKVEAFMKSVARSAMPL